MYKSTVGPLALMEDFLRLTEKYFPVYFHEDFPAHWEDGGRVNEVPAALYFNVVNPDPNIGSVISNFMDLDPEPN